MSEWKCPPQDKLYLGIGEAGEYSGLGVKEIRRLMNSRRPLPYIMHGERKMIQRKGLEKYLEELQEVRL